MFNHFSSFLSFQCTSTQFLSRNSVKSEKPKKRVSVLCCKYNSSDWYTYIMCIYSMVPRLQFFLMFLLTLRISCVSVCVLVYTQFPCILLHFYLPLVHCWCFCCCHSTNRLFTSSCLSSNRIAIKVIVYFTLNQLAQTQMKMLNKKVKKRKNNTDTSTHKYKTKLVIWCSGTLIWNIIVYASVLEDRDKQSKDIWSSKGEKTKRGIDNKAKK